MVRCYITTEQEINAVKQRLSELRQHAILCRDAGDEKSSAVLVCWMPVPGFEKEEK